MSADEIRELMQLRNWSPTQLAAALDLTENAVSKWLRAGQAPGGPVTILLREWLARARAEAGKLVASA